MRRHVLMPFSALVAFWLAGPGGAAADVNLARLPAVVAPTAQSARLTVDPAKSAFSGSVHIDLKASARADTFQFNSRGMTIESLRLTADGRTLPVAWREAPLERITVTPVQPLKAGRYGLDVRFSRPFDDKAVGLYRLQTAGDWYAFTQFESDDARQAFPCWDEPMFKIPWTLTLSVPKGEVVIANTPETSRREADGMVEVSFATSHPMPSYLVAFCVGPFEVTPIPGLSVPGRILTVKGQKGMTGEAAKMTPVILAALEHWFGSPYPFEKLDLISVPEYNWGAMENPGAVTFAERVLSLDPTQTTDGQRRRLAADIAHELAHMWFGDLVTMKWWDDLWLNESFASWMGDKITHECYPAFNMPVQEMDGKQRAYAADVHLSTHAVRSRVDENVNLSQLADELAYDKGQAVLGMFEAWMGPAKFRSGVIAYLKAHAWGNAEAADLWRALSTSSHSDVGAMMATFLDQPGVPLVTAEPLDGGRVRLSQQRYLTYGETAPSAQLWQIPVVLEYSDGTRTVTQSTVLKEPTMTLTLSPSATIHWLHPNADERGYYIWSVPAPMLAKLTTEARPKLTERERVGLVHGLDLLLASGQLHGDDYLRAIGMFGDDPSPDVVSAVLEGLQGVRFAFVTADLRDAYAHYIRATLAPAYHRLGDTPKPAEGPDVAALRAQLMGQLGTIGGDATLRAWGTETTRKLLADPASVDPTLADVALRLAATANDPALYAELRRRFETSKTPQDRRRYLQALGGFHDPALVDSTLSYALHGPLRPQEVLTSFRAFESPELVDKGWQWAQANYDAIAAKIPPMFRVYLVYFAMGCSRERIEAAKAFFSQPDHAPLGTDQELAKLSDRINECASLREREGARVAAMLRDTASAN